MLSNVPARFAHEAAGMRINRDNVLEVAKVLMAQADDLQEVLAQNADARADLCGGDPVSADAKLAFNKRAGALVDSYASFVLDLRQLATAVAESARAYGVSDEDIARSFDR
ncbi:hypothetical protein [Pseudonocardia sp.]|jgi:hypothetical protein|uniref:hypothetical protein n=1 Tax=Pseudonocardia sp. TaxID=60912 RepID=UPI003D12410C